jgi:hypothetical protein
MDINGLWDQDVQLTTDEQKFKEYLETQIAQEKQDQKLRTQREKQLKFVYKKVWNTMTKGIHQLRDTVMIAVNPVSEADMKEQNAQLKQLADLEMVIYNRTFDHFSKTTSDITVDAIRWYVNMPSISALIILAFKRVYSMQGKSLEDIQSVSMMDENTKVAYIINTLCSDTADYTEMNGTSADELEKMLQTCTSIEPDATAGVNMVNPPGQGSGQGSGYFYWQHPTTNTWFLVNAKDATKKSRIPFELVSRLIPSTNVAGKRMFDEYQQRTTKEQLGNVDTMASTVEQIKTEVLDEKSKKPATGFMSWFSRGGLSKKARLTKKGKKQHRKTRKSHSKR